MLKFTPLDRGHVELSINDQTIDTFTSVLDAKRYLCNQAIIQLDYRLESEPNYIVQVRHLEEYIFNEQYEDVAIVYITLIKTNKLIHENV
jgi:hypothetical protein